MPSIDISNIKTVKKKQDARGSVTTGKIAALFEKDFSLTGSGLKDEKKEYLYLELGALLKAGVDFRSALELVASGQEKPKDKALFSGILKAVVEGSPFSAALRKTGEFSLYEIYSLQIGEETGELQQVLTDLAYFFKTRISQRRTIVSALTYPAIVLSAAAGALYFMLRFVVPMFSDIFRRSGGELPWITRQMVAVSHGVGSYGWIVFLCTLALTGLCVYFRKQLWFRDLTSRLVLRLPLAGGLTRKIYLARLSNTMRLLIDARLPLLRSLVLCRQMIGFFPLEKALAVMEADILRGVPLHESMAKFPVFPPKMVQLMKVGEKTSQMDAFFDWIGKQYVAEAELQTASLNRILQPVIIIVLGIVIGVIVIAIYLPLFEISNTIQ